MFRNKSKWKSILQFFIVFLVIFFALFVSYYGQEVRRYNTTLLAFNYSYGFISRGLLGTLYLGLDMLLPKDILNYTDAVNITFIATNVVMLVFIFLVLFILIKTRGNRQNGAQNILIYFTVFFVPMFFSFRNMGRPDIYMLFFTFLGLMLLIAGKMEWLIVPCSIFSVMIHQGYVFMFYNIFMYPLLYKIFQTSGKERRKYIGILATSFVSVSALFLYFNFFSHMSGQETYDSIYALAAQLGNNGEVYETLLTHELLGIDPWEQELPQHIYNFIELPIYCLIMSPFIVLGVRLYKNIICAAKTKLDKIKYALLPICSVTIVPCYILKMDFGRWIFAGVAYFALVTLVLYAFHDEVVTEQVDLLITEVQAKYSYAPLLLVYVATMIPLHDIHINEVLRSISEWLDFYYLHIIA